MAAITISRQFGAGALFLGEKICKKTGFHIVDQTIIDKVICKEEACKNWLDTLIKESASISLQALSEIADKSWLKKSLGIPIDAVERKRYFELLTDIIMQLANKGGFVIIGRGAQFILKDHPKTIHVLLISGYEKRLSMVAETFNISYDQAKEMIKLKEENRYDLGANIFNENIDDPSHYHLVLNTGKIDLDCAVDAILTTIEKQIEHNKGNASWSSTNALEREVEPWLPMPDAVRFSAPPLASNHLKKPKRSGSLFFRNRDFSE